MSGEITVLRIGHRKKDDRRLSTHLGLIARAFGAKRMVLDVEDEHVKNTIDDVTKNWGGDFEVLFMPWKKAIKKFPGKLIHLTMYGEPVDNFSWSRSEDYVIAVGSQKIPPELYEISDLNIAIGNQPHSEAAALSIMLDRVFTGSELKKEFSGAKRKIISQKRGKKVVEL